MTRHISHSALVRVFSGQASGPETETAVPHLARCPKCWDRAGRAVSELRDEGRLATSSEACNAVLVLLAEEEGQALARLRARAGWAELRRLSARQQLGRLEADPALRTLDLFHTMVDGAASASREDPLLGEETALVAHALAGALPAGRYPESFRNDLQSEALAIVANCRRLAGDWRGSAAALTTARGHLLRGTGDPAREAWLLSVQASLAADTGHLEKAMDLLTRASALYRKAQDAEAAAAVTVQEAGTLLAASRPEEAIARAEEVLRLPGAARLERLARNVVTESLVRLGRPAEALRSFLATQPLDRGRRTELQAGYLEALLLDSLGHPREAEKAFRNNIAGCMEAELYKEAFLTLLAQLEALFRRGASDKAARVCKEALFKIEQAGTACHGQIAELWQDLLALVDARRLAEGHLFVARQYLVRHWNVPARHAPLVGVPSLSKPSRFLAMEASSPEPILENRSSGPAPAAASLALGGYEEALERYDRDLIAAGLARCGGRVRETSRLLGISRNTLRGKIRKYGLPAGDSEPFPAVPDEKDDPALSRLRARAWWAELKTLPHGQQSERIKTVSSLQTREMFDMMIEEAAAAALNDPHLGEATALLAHTLAGLLPRGRCPEPARNDLQGGALVIVANCRRLAGDWPGSAAALGAARSHLERGSGEPAREARLLSIEASLSSDMGHTEQALALLEHSAKLYLRAQDLATGASVTVKAAGTLLAACRHEEAIARAEEALKLLSVGEDRLELFTRNIITESLAHLGRPAEALRSFLASEALHEQLRGHRTGLRLGYLEAILLDALGHVRESELVFQSLIVDFMEASLYKDAFLTMLTHFVSLFRRGELARAARACEEALKRIEEAGVEGHAPMTDLWQCLLTLVNARRLTESHLLEARQYLVRCGNAPAQRARTLALPAWVPGAAVPEPADPSGPAEAETAGLSPASPGGPLALTAPPDPAASLAEVGYEEALVRYDRQLLASGLAQSQGRIGETCRLLGISRNQLRSKLRRYFLTNPVSAAGA